MGHNRHNRQIHIDVLLAAHTLKQRHTSATWHHERQKTCLYVHIMSTNIVLLLALTRNTKETEASQVGLFLFIVVHYRVVKRRAQGEEIFSGMNGLRWET